MSVTAPDGSKISASYQSVLVNESIDRTKRYYRARPTSVTNNHGYRLNYTYRSNLTGLSYLNDWLALASVTAVNLARDNCAPGVTGCALAAIWPSVTIEPSAVTPGAMELTDPAGHTTIYRPLGLTFPSGRTASITIASGKVASWTGSGVTYSYSYTDSADVRTTIITSSGAVGAVYTHTYTSSISKQLILTSKNGLNKTTSYTYDAQDRLTRTTFPEGNYVNYTYDARGNVTETRHVGKPGSSAADIVTTATFPATCTNTVICNKPTQVTDAKGNVTTYAYDTTHGGVTSVTQPAPSSGASKPKKSNPPSIIARRPLSKTAGFSP